MYELNDFPKLECPFVRKIFPIEKDSFRRYRRKLNLRKPEVYLAVDEINPGYEWVFDDPDTFATEKIDGSNVKVLVEEGKVVHVQNRKNVVRLLNMKNKVDLYITDGIIQAAMKGYVGSDGEQAGELLGPKFQGNPYWLRQHLWYPFDRAISQLRYNSFSTYDRTYDNWSSWFREYLFSLFYQKISMKQGACKDTIMAEGVVFYNLRRKAEGKTYMAKLRRDMFDWYYTDHLEILS